MWGRPRRNPAPARQPARRRTHGLLSHLRQDEVCGAVDDASEPLDSIAGKPFADGFDDGDSASYRRFERDGDPIRLRSGKDFIAVQRDKRLVGSHHMFARSNRFENEFTRQLGSTH